MTKAPRVDFLSMAEPAEEDIKLWHLSSAQTLLTHRWKANTAAHALLNPMVSTIQTGILNNLSYYRGSAGGLEAPV